MRRQAIQLGLICGFFLGITLSVAPQVHERVHPDATQSQHQCAATLIASGNCEHTAAPPALITAAAENQFAAPQSSAAAFVASVFLGAVILEHAPPQNS